MPISSVRDVIVKDDDLVAATHGRGFWILDDITPLRQVTPAIRNEDAFLFAPTVAWRVRWNTSTDMPWPVEEPAGTNPPDGVPIDYFLKQAASSPVTLTIENADGRIVRRHSSADAPAAIPEPASAPVPLYWYRTPQVLSAAAGMHRFVWDVHYQPLTDPSGGAAGGGRGGLPIQAIPNNTAPAAGTPFASPGVYRVKLTVNGKTLTQPITVRQDPRVKTPAPAMLQVYSLTNAMYFGALDAQAAAATAAAWRDQASKLKASASGEVGAALDRFAEKAGALAGSPPSAAGGRGGRGGGGGAPAPSPGSGPTAETLWGVRTQLSGLMNSMQAADVAPTANTLAAVTVARAAADRVMTRWQSLKTVDLPALNAKLKGTGLVTID